MRRFKKLTAGLLSACLSLQLLTTGVVSASEVNDDTVIIQETEEPTVEEKAAGDSDVEADSNKPAIVTENIEDDIVGNAVDDAVEITELDKEYDAVFDGETEMWFCFVPEKTGY